MYVLVRAGAVIVIVAEEPLMMMIACRNVLAAPLLRVIVPEAENVAAPAIAVSRRAVRLLLMLSPQTPASPPLVG
jgi:hypothetical protein